MDRLEQFEKMLLDIQNQYSEVSGKMDALRAAGKEKSATFRQYMGMKLVYKNMLEQYRTYGLTDFGEECP